MNKRKPIAIKVRVDLDTYEQIEELARENDSTLSGVIRYFVEEGLKAYEK